MATTRQRKVERIPRLQDVARLAGVSIATASMAIANHPGVSPDTKQRIWHASRELGYKRLRAEPDSQKPARFGVVMLRGTYGNMEHPDFFFDVATRTNPSVRFEYTATPSNVTAQEAAEHTVQFAAGMDALVIMEMASREYLAALRKKQIPHVVVGSVMEEPDDPTPTPACVICYDAMGMGLVATRYLLSKGHCNIAFLTEHLPINFQHDQWLRGYRLAHAERNMLPAANLIAVTDRYEGGVSQAVDTWAKAGKSKPTAIIAPDVRLVPLARLEMARLKLSIDTSDIVVSATTEGAKRYGVLEHPRLIGRADLLVERTLHTLNQVIANPQLEPFEVRVPYELHHLNFKKTKA